MLFKPKMVDEVCVHAQYVDNIGLKIAQSSGLNQKKQQDTCKEGKKKEIWGKDKNMASTIP